MSQETIDQLNVLFAELVVTAKGKALRDQLAKLNQLLSDSSGGVINYVNWNS